MFVSVFELFKIGIGPSSSHTMGPMVAAARFLDSLRRDGHAPERVSCTLYGSLAHTGKGHGTDRAVILGLMGCDPSSVDPDRADAIEARVRGDHRVAPPGLPAMAFSPEADLHLDLAAPLPGHPNGLTFAAVGADGSDLASETYYSIGGGFVLSAEELTHAGTGEAEGRPVPYPFGSAAEMLEMSSASGLSIAGMKRANELTIMSEAELNDGLSHVWSVMESCIERGLAADGSLPGGLDVARRARGIHQRLIAERGSNSLQPHQVVDWLSVYAMAVNEENAAGGRVVTAPTNGAAGVIPSVIRYYRDHCVGAEEAGIADILLTAAAIGGLIKANASISGAECGCQAEVGSASAMAAAGLAAALGGSPAQVENAAEIALEHHLGMTCDPAGGLVQVPCIERNGIGAIKAVSATSLALHGDGSHFMPLDNCIEAMRQIGADMSSKFKETSLGGLAVNLPEC